MKIGYDAKRLFFNASGLGNYSRDLLRILSEKREGFSFLLFSKKASDRGAFLLEKDHVELKVLKGGKFARQFSMGIQAQEEGCDLFHGLSGELPLKWNSKPIGKILTVHDLIFLRYPKYYSFFDRKIHLWKVKKAAEVADRIIAISKRTAEDLVELLGVDPKKIEVIYQGCHESFKEVKTREELNAVKEKYALPDRYLLSVGTIEERKNLLGIAKALHLLKDTNIPLVVVGKKTSYYNKVVKFFKKHGLENRVVFLSGVTMQELSCVYILADVFVYPSRYEGFGIPIIEALYSGTPVIAANSSCLQEAGGPSSLYVLEDKEEDLASKIKYLWDNEAKRREMKEKGLEYVQRFNDQRIITEVLDLYERVHKEVVEKSESL